MSSIENIQSDYQESLLDKQGVEGTAIGEKWRDGKPTGEKAILVFVQKKYPEKSINSQRVLTAYSAKDLVPSQIEGVPTDVIEVGHITKQAELITRVRPIRPGFSCGHGSISAGTIGGIFIDKSNRLVILSNNHVLANENRAKLGEAIYQPGPADLALTEDNIIGKLAKYVKMNNRNNTQDSAIAYISPDIISTNQISDLYPHINQRLKGFGEVTVGQSVQKCGRTTGYTTGRVLGVNASFGIHYDFGPARFNQCIVLSAMSKPGDSGSIIMDMDGNAVALLFAGSDKVTIASPINIIRESYGLQLYTGNTASISQLDSVRPDAGPIWKCSKSADASAKISTQKMIISSLKNNYCYIEAPISDFKEVSCEVNTGTDTGVIWGPGLSVHWPNGFLKLNLRYASSFGGYSHLDNNLDAGKVKPNTTYGLRIRIQDNTYIGEIRDNGDWIKVIQTPITIFNNSPVSVKLGKTDIMATNRQHRILGPRGECSISNFNII